MTKATFIEAACGQSDLSEEDAARVLDFYVQENLATYNNHDFYQLKHGALLDCDVLERASQAALLRGIRIP